MLSVQNTLAQMPSTQDPALSIDKGIDEEARRLSALQKQQLAERRDREAALETFLNLVDSTSNPNAEVTDEHMHLFVELLSTQPLFAASWHVEPKLRQPARPSHLKAPWQPLAKMGGMKIRNISEEDGDDDDEDEESESSVTEEPEQHQCPSTEHDMSADTLAPLSQFRNLFTSERIPGDGASKEQWKRKVHDVLDAMEQAGQGFQPYVVHSQEQRVRRGNAALIIQKYYRGMKGRKHVQKVRRRRTQLDAQAGMEAAKKARRDLMQQRAFYKKLLIQQAADALLAMQAQEQYSRVRERLGTDAKVNSAQTVNRGGLSTCPGLLEEDVCKMTDELGMDPIQILVESGMTLRQVDLVIGSSGFDVVELRNRAAQGAKAFEAKLAKLRPEENVLFTALTSAGGTSLSRPPTSTTDASRPPTASELDAANAVWHEAKRVLSQSSRMTAADVQRAIHGIREDEGSDDGNERSSAGSMPVTSRKAHRHNRSSADGTGGPSFAMPTASFRARLSGGGADGSSSGTDAPPTHPPGRSMSMTHSALGSSFGRSSNRKVGRSESLSHTMPAQRSASGSGRLDGFKSSVLPSGRPSAATSIAQPPPLHGAPRSRSSRSDGGLGIRPNSSMISRVAAAPSLNQAELQVGAEEDRLQAWRRIQMPIQRRTSLTSGDPHMLVPPALPPIHQTSSGSLHAPRAASGTYCRPGSASGSRPGSASGQCTALPNGVVLNGALTTNFVQARGSCSWEREAAEVSAWTDAAPSAHNAPSQMPPPQPSAFYQGAVQGEVGSLTKQGTADGSPVVKIGSCRDSGSREHVAAVAASTTVFDLSLGLSLGAIMEGAIQKEDASLLQQAAAAVSTDEGPNGVLQKQRSLGKSLDGRGSLSRKSSVGAPSSDRPHNLAASLTCQSFSKGGSDAAKGGSDAAKGGNDAAKGGNDAAKMRGATEGRRTDGAVADKVSASEGAGDKACSPLPQAPAAVTSTTHGLLPLHSTNTGVAADGKALAPVRGHAADDALGSDEAAPTGALSDFVQDGSFRMGPDAELTPRAGTKADSPGDGVVDIVAQAGTRRKELSKDCCESEAAPTTSTEAAASHPASNHGQHMAAGEDGGAFTSAPAPMSPPACNSVRALIWSSSSEISRTRSDTTAVAARTGLPTSRSSSLSSRVPPRPRPPSNGQVPTLVGQVSGELQAQGSAQFASEGGLVSVLQATSLGGHSRGPPDSACSPSSARPRSAVSRAAAQSDKGAQGDDGGQCPSQDTRESPAAVMPTNPAEATGPEAPSTNVGVTQMATDAMIFESQASSSSLEGGESSAYLYKEAPSSRKPREAGFEPSGPSREEVEHYSAEEEAPQGSSLLAPEKYGAGGPMVAPNRVAAHLQANPGDQMSAADLALLLFNMDRGGLDMANPFPAPREVPSFMRAPGKLKAMVPPEPQFGNMLPGDPRGRPMSSSSAGGVKNTAFPSIKVGGAPLAAQHAPPKVPMQAYSLREKAARLPERPATVAALPATQGLYVPPCMPSFGGSMKRSFSRGSARSNRE